MNLFLILVCCQLFKFLFILDLLFFFLIYFSCFISIAKNILIVLVFC